MNLKISFNDIEFINGFFYAASNVDNGLYRFNETICELICEFEGENNTQNLFSQTITYEDKIIFTPLLAKNIHIYDIKTNKITRIEIDNKELLGKFHSVVLWKNNAILLPIDYPSLIKIDLKNYKIEYLNDVMYSLNSKASFMNYGYIDEDNLYAVHLYSNTLIKYNLNTNETKLRNMDIVGEKIWGYFVENKTEYILSSEGFFIIKDGNVKYSLKDPSFKEGTYLFSAYKHDNLLFFIPFQYHQPAFPIKIDLFEIETNQHEMIFKNVICNDKCSFRYIKSVNDKIYTWLNYKNHMIEYEIETNFLKEYPSSAKKNIDFENKNFRFSDWISMIKQNC